MDQGSIMKKYEVIEAAPNRSGWRVVDGEFMVWQDISHHATKEEAEAAKALHRAPMRRPTGRGKVK